MQHAVLFSRALCLCVDAELCQPVVDYAMGTMFANFIDIKWSLFVVIDVRDFIDRSKLRETKKKNDWNWMARPMNVLIQLEIRNHSTSCDWTERKRNAFRLPLNDMLVAQTVARSRQASQMLEIKKKTKCCAGIIERAACANLKFDATIEKRIRSGRATHGTVDRLTFQLLVCCIAQAVENSIEKMNLSWKSKCLLWLHRRRNRIDIRVEIWAASRGNVIHVLRRTFVVKTHAHLADTSKDCSADDKQRELPNTQ